MPPIDPLIHVITLNWNGLADTLECLDSLTRLDYPNYRVHVVDNGSTDGSPAAIRQRYPWVLVSEVGENRGVAGGNNVGLRAALQAGAAFVLLVNNDTVLDPGILRAFMEAAARHPPAGVFGAKVYYHAQPDILWTAGSTVDGGGQSRSLGVGQRDGPEWDRERECDYVCGCGLLARAEVFARTGLFDERFFLMWQETDWCHRARRAGWGIRYVPRARLWHKVSRSFVGGVGGPHQTYFYFRNRLLWMRKNVPWRRRLTMWRWGVLPDLRRQLAPLGRRADPIRRRAARAALRGVADYFLGRYGNGPAWIYRNRVESD